MAKPKAIKRNRDRANGDFLGHATSRGLLQALDAIAYERAYEVILKDPGVQGAIDALLDSMLAAIRKRRAARKK